MAKNETKWKCSNCGRETRQWVGKCPQCGEFSTMEEVTLAAPTAASPSGKAGLKNGGAVTPVSKASTIDQLNAQPIKKFATGIGEFDRVLGGGLVEGQVILLAAQPGTGKSTLCLDLANRFAQAGAVALYSSGEESVNQIGLRAKRMGVNDPNIRIVNETSLETLLGHVDAENPKFLVVDSLQTLASNEIAGSMGSISQSKEAAHTLTTLAKSRGISMVLISQMTKGDEFSGSNSIAHIVDTTMFMESDEETPLKFLRATKNRFSEIGEVGVFAHAETGLEEVSDPSGVFMELYDKGEKVTGTACSFVTEGIRQIPLEVQALVNDSSLPNPRKQFNGVDYNRGQIVCAILDKFARCRLYEKDVFVSTVSGLKVKDPQADLAIAAAIISSLKEKDFGVRTAFVGELALTGHLRGAFMVENKIREAERLGFQRIVLPAASQKAVRGKYAIEIKYLSTVDQLTKLLVGP